MNIELMKQLEDLKSQSQKLHEKLSTQIDTKKKQYIYGAKKDFADFFKERDFTVNSSNLSVTATYGELISRLSHNDPKTDYFGCYFTFNLDLKSFNGDEYNIILNKNIPHLSINVSTKNPNNSSDSDLQQEIVKKQNSIRETESRLDNFNQEVWNFYIKIPNTTPQQYSEPYASIYDLLASLIE